MHVYKLSQADRCKKLLKYVPKNITLVFEQTSKCPFDDFLEFKKIVNANTVIDTAHLWASGTSIEEFLKSGLIPTIIHLNGNSLGRGVK